MSTRNASGASPPHDVVIMRLYRSRAGQIFIPAMLMFPTLFLFVYLIYETAKLSREKIRHQFALDAAAFVEMTNYSDFLNRTAYVNGAFPHVGGAYQDGHKPETTLSGGQWNIEYEPGRFGGKNSNPPDLTPPA